MASKVASVAETAETREEAAEAPLLDQIAVAIKKMVARGKERGYLTYDELNAALPTDQVSSEQIEDTMTMLSELGINVVENEDAEEPAAADSEDGEAEARGNLDDDDIGRTDDPVRMYLREMGSVELLSREGEIAIAKRIEAGREMMIGGICESPLTVRALVLWRDALEEGKMLLRDIIDLDATYASTAIDPADPAAVVVVPPLDAAAGAEEEDEEAEVEVEEEVVAEGGIDGEDGEGEESSVSLATMEAQLRPSVVAIFDQVAEIHKKLGKLQDQRVSSIVKGAPLARATDRRYDKLKDEAIELLQHIRFNNTRIEHLVE
jgi:RNA polymerase primary sigma factor